MNFTDVRTLIVEDDVKAAVLLKGLLAVFPVFGTISTLDNPALAFNEIIKQPPDYLFLDIEMPEISGLELLERISSVAGSTRVIIVTGHERYAIQALRHQAFDYLLKPVGRADLVRLAERLIGNNLEPVNKSARQMANGHVLITTAEGIYHLKTNDILFLEADCAYTKVVLCNERKILTGCNIGKMISMLPPCQFLRISRKHVINRDHLAFCNVKGKYVSLMSLGKEHRISVSLRVGDLKQKLVAS